MPKRPPDDARRVISASVLAILVVGLVSRVLGYVGYLDNPQPGDSCV